MRNFRTLFILVIATLCLSFSAPSVYSSDIGLASWNIRILSSKSRTDKELQYIANILIRYDFIAISELRDELVLKRLQKMLSDMGVNYDYEISEPVGRGVKERYAFLYDTAFISVIEPGQRYPDELDGEDDFMRDPYWATFRAGQFDFTVINVHVVWGKRVGDRRAEVQELASVYNYVQEQNGDEQDVILLGDFNRNPNDKKAYTPLLDIPTMTMLFQLPEKSHIRDTSLYDNMMFQTKFVTEYKGQKLINRFDDYYFPDNDKAASLAVSDHRPISAIFSTIKDDD